MRRRAEQVDTTRLRITEAAVRLHTTVGPANTSIASVAEEAGVTRVTVYRHFADLDALFEACTAHWRSLNPPPDAQAWAAIPDLEERAQLAFGALYRWYRDHAGELYPIYRDAAAMPPSARLAAVERDRALAEAILTGLSDDRLTRAIATHLVGFMTWHELAVRQDLADREVVSLAVLVLTATADAASSA